MESLKFQISEQKIRLNKLKNNKNSKHKKKKVRIISRELSKLTSKLNEVKVVIMKWIAEGITVLSVREQRI